MIHKRDRARIPRVPPDMRTEEEGHEELTTETAPPDDLEHASQTVDPARE
jgi:hypothetical protein